MDIYKINHIFLNQNKTQFCICTNKGINIFSAQTFSQLDSSNSNEITLGEISKANLLYELNIVVFVGSENNEEYNNKKLVFYDLVNKKEIYSTFFISPIIDIKSILKYVFVISNKELIVYSYANLNEINLISSIPFLNEKNFGCVIWNKKENDNLNEKIYIAMYEKKEKDVSIISYFSKNYFYKQQSKTINSPFSKIQNMFYIEELDQIFIVDGTGCYISSFDVETNKLIYNLYRGNKQGEIISMCKFTKNHLAVVNKNKTIHIFDLKDTNGYNITNILYKMVSSTIYSMMKIRLKDVFKGFEDSFYNLYYNKYGCFIFNLNNSNDISVIGYNGVGLNIKINFSKNTYQIFNAKKFLEKKNNTFGQSVNIYENDVIISSIYEIKDSKVENWDML